MIDCCKSDPQQETLLIDIPETLEENTSKTCKKVVAIPTKLLLSSVIALPTAFLNFLSQLNIDVGSISSLEQLKEVIQSKSQKEIGFASASAADSFIFNLITNYAYVPNNLTKLKETLRDLAIVISRGRLNPARFAEIKAPELRINTGSFLVALFPALAFASIGYDEGKFYLALAWFFFFTNMVSYWMTRFSGTSDIINKAYLMLKNVHREDEFPMITGRSYIALIIVGSLMGLTTALLTLPIWATRTLSGFEKLTNSSWFGADNFQDPGQLAFGWIAGAPNSFFYFMSNYLVPFLLIKTFSNLFNIFQNENISPKGKAFYLLMTIFAIVGSAWTGQGMGDVAKSEIDDSDLAYISPVVDETTYRAVAWAGASGVNLKAALALLNGAMEKLLKKNNFVELRKSRNSFFSNGDPGRDSNPGRGWGIFSKCRRSKGPDLEESMPTLENSIPTLEDSIPTPIDDSIPTYEEETKPSKRCIVM